MSPTSEDNATASLRAVLQVLEEEGIDYCLLHRWSSFPVVGDSDVDIVVREDVRGSVGLLMRDGLGETDLRLVQMLEHEATACLYVLAFRDERGETSFLKIDVCSSYRRDGRILFEPDEYLEGRSRSSGFWVPSAGLEFACYLAKRSAKGAIDESGYRLLQQDYRAGPDEALRILSRLMSESGVEVVRELFETGSKEDFDARLVLLREDIMRATAPRTPSSLFGYWLPEARRGVRRLRRPAGMHVVVLGPDGAGKSQVVEGLSITVGGAFSRVNVEHLRPKVLPGRSGAAGGAETDPHGKEPYPWLVSQAKMAYLLADYLVGYAVRIRPQMVRASLVLYDRYFHDLVVDPRRFRYQGPGSLLRLCLRLLPSPDIVFILDADAATLQRRKSEVPYRESERQRAEYADAASRLENAVLLDATRPLGDVIDAASTETLRVLGERLT